MSHTEAPWDNVDHEAHMRDVMADVADFRREIRDLRTERDAAVAHIKTLEIIISREARMKRTIHVGCSPLSNNIYAGYVLKDGMTWSDTNKTDVTHAAIGAVCEHAERFGAPITVNRNGHPAYRLTVEPLSEGGKGE